MRITCGSAAPALRGRRHRLALTRTADVRRFPVEPTVNQETRFRIMNMNSIVPLISSGVAGPLGVLHLPRLWLKLSLEESGKLASGYPGIGHGFDAMTLAAL